MFVKRIEGAGCSKTGAEVIKLLQFPAGALTVIFIPVGRTVIQLYCVVMIDDLSYCIKRFFAGSARYAMRICPYGPDTAYLLPGPVEIIQVVVHKIADRIYDVSQKPPHLPHGIQVRL